MDEVRIIAAILTAGILARGSGTPSTAAKEALNAVVQLEAIEARLRQERASDSSTAASTATSKSC